MLFNSLHFVFLFFPLVTLGYFLLPYRLRHFWILAASCYFYMAFAPLFILILLYLIAVDFAAGLAIERSEGKRRKRILILSLIANIGTLAVFKYFDFFNTNLSELAHAIGWNYSIPNLNLLLPLGLSFHTFQSMAYTIDVYRGKQKAETDIWIYSLYVMYYPQLVAGPIERPGNLLHQLKEPRDFDGERFVSGMKLVLFGFFKKLVIADRLGPFVDNVYGGPALANGLSLLLATYFFAFQIYCDFSGYTDIARGISRVMGIELMRNFDHPYRAKSIADFWKRWHISLSNWFRDYLYGPLMSLGNGLSYARAAGSMFFVFLISGLWHGANWTFVVWGALHGIYLVVGLYTEEVRYRIAHALRFDRFPRVRNAWKVFITFHLVCLAFVFFRAETVHVAFYILGHMFRGWQMNISYVGGALLPFSQNNTALSHFLFMVTMLGLLEAVQWNERRQVKDPNWGARWSGYRDIAWSGVLLLTLFMGNFGSKSFIYFQF